jgi:hypothetical protein
MAAEKFHVSKYGTEKLKIVFISSVTPYMLKTDDNVEGEREILTVWLKNFRRPPCISC